MKKTTFKQYLIESRDQLLQAIDNTPVSLIEYDICKYCSIPVGETEDEKISIGLRPKNKIIVEWRYDNLLNPTPLSVRFTGSKDAEDNEKYTTFLTGTKLHQWLRKHASEGQNNGHKI